MQRSWRKRFFVLSEGTLSFYRNATPRPHGLRGQMVVTDATIAVDRSKDKANNFIVSIVTKDGLKDRFLHFNNEDKLLAWAYALECTAKGTSLSSKTMLRKLANPRDSAKYQDSKPPESTVTEQSTKDQVENSMKAHVANLELEIDDMDERLARLSANKSSSVKISVEASTEYKICTLDPQGDDGDTWATISSTFLQKFIISGGRIVRGEEIVRVHVSECPFVIDFSQALDNPSASEETLSPASIRRSLGLRARTRTLTDG
jgi:hypothetical protein